ncbi:hypothetical protein Clacol_009213 [Clathrus columnatus]|uniref:Uncharacterized protein n=1 Tax=Clathrus columnatus TaxID=1419009 RepID=A0AAV5AN52_9AGAM|nr:hypothetical protein Clacol_009213 [Clathrus columnatus]
MGLFDPLAEIGYVIRDAVSYKGTTELPSRGWSTILNAVKGKTYFDFSLSIRQKVIEEIIRERIRCLDRTALRSAARLITYTIDSSKEHSVRAEVQENGKAVVIQCKYLIGADGGKSTVRHLAGISFPGVTSTFKWIRLDGIVKSDMPASRQGGVAVESSTYGSVLWTPTDSGRTRIGFICSDELYSQGVSAEVVMNEAKKAVKPFTLEFINLDWWTVYAIGQRVAETFYDGPVLLVGDAAHTHSSGAAQGMNTGFHDASNLGWKLAGVLKGWFHKSILNTYDTERRASVEHLIQLDKDVASLISGVIPEHYNPPSGANVHDYLNRVFEENAAFTVGLGINYELNVVNTTDRESLKCCNLQIGYRLPDVLLYRPGVNIPKRLYEFMPNIGVFYTLVMVGELDPDSPQPRLKQENLNALNKLRSSIEERFNLFQKQVRFLTIVKGSTVVQTTETLQGPPIGKALYDIQGQCYDLYGINESISVVIIVRPDGIVSSIMPLDEPEKLWEYFSNFMKPNDDSSYGFELDQKVFNQGEACGEVSLEDEA